MPDRVRVGLNSSAGHDVRTCRAGHDSTSHGGKGVDDVTSRGRDGGGDPCREQNGGLSGDPRGRVHAYREDLARGAGWRPGRVAVCAGRAALRIFVLCLHGPARCCYRQGSQR